MSDQTAGAPAESSLRRATSAVMDALPAGAQLPEPLFQRWDRFIRAIVWAHAPVLGIIVLRQPGGFAWHNVAEAATIPVLALSLHFVGDRIWRACLTSFALVTCSAMLVHLTHGLIEAHFHFFIVVALIALYQDWRPYLLAGAYVLIHHGVLGSLAPDAVFNHPAAVQSPLLWAAIHAGAIAATAGVQLVFWRGNEKARAQYQQARIEAAASSERASFLSSRAESAERSARLLHVATALSQAITVDEVSSVLVDEGSSTLGALTGGVMLLDETRTTMRLVRSRGISAELQARWPASPLPTQTPGNEAVRTGQAQYISSAAEISARYPRYTDEVQDKRMSCAALPLEAGGRSLGAWLLTWDFEREFAEEDRVFVGTLAALGAHALERARLYEHERNSATLLQQGLLPPSLPAVPGLTIVTRYLPGAEDVEVGGDWYDVLHLPSGALGFAVGDVTGHNLEAAAAMGQMRATLRAYAAEGHSPAEVLQRMNRLLSLPNGPDEEYSARLATCIYLELDPHSGRLTVTSAGHPPPLVVPAGGSPYLVDLEPHLPLGIDPATPYTESTLVMAPGETVILYTDGLVEDRDLPLQQGLERLLAQAAEPAAETPEGLADHLIASLPARDTADDITLLALRRDQVIADPEAHCRLPAIPASAGEARAFVREALAQAGCLHLTDTAELLVSELATNAVSHTASTEIDVALRANPDVIRVYVTDVSESAPVIQQPSVDRTSGRGLAIIEALATDWGVEDHDPGKSVWFALTR